MNKNHTENNTHNHFHKFMTTQDYSDCSVSYRISIDHKAGSVLLIRTIKHILYHSGHIPCTFEELETYVEEAACKRNSLPKGRKRLVAGVEKKAQKLYDAANKLFDAITNLMVCQNPISIDQVVLSFGASLFAPNAVYLIKFESPFIISNNTYSNDDILQKCEQKLVRSMIASGNNLFAKNIRKTNMNVVIRTRKTFLSTTDFVAIPTYHPDPVTMGIRNKKSLPLRITLDWQSSLLDENEDVDEMMWYRCKHSIKGFRGKIILEA